MPYAESKDTPEEQPWQALLDSAGEGIWGVDLQGRCTFVNRAACAALGYAPDELVGCDMHRMVHHHYPDGRPYPGSECIVYNVFRQGKSFQNHVDHLFRKDGSIFYAEMSAQPILHRGATYGAVVTFRDITQARRSEEALRRSEKLAAVGQLASSIAHEINNPLEAVTNLLFLIRNAGSLEEIQEYAAQAEAELARVADITTQTLRFHRQQSAAALVDLTETVPAILRLYTGRFRSREIKVALRLGPCPPAMLLEGDIRQVLNNLIRNAYDAMPGGGMLSVRLRPANCLRDGVPGLRLTIADTGTGFLPSIREHLYEPFHTSKEITGTGLGLWISKGIIDKHAGRISMRSRLAKPGQPGLHGTIFALWLPLQPQLAMAPEANTPMGHAGRQTVRAAHPCAGALNRRVFSTGPMKRILTGAVLIAVVAALIFFDIPWLITVFSALVALLAAVEFRGLAAKADAVFPLPWLVASIALFFVAGVLQPFDLVAVVSLSTLVLFAWSSFRSPLPRVLGETGAGLFTLVYIAYPLSLVPRILAAEDGTALLLFLFLCVWCGDIAALYIGRNFGKRKLAPALSPNKTWEGSIASVLGSVVFGMGLIALGNWFTAHGSSFTRLHTAEPPWHFLLLAIALNLAAQLGDLVESALKRGVGVKDSGTLLPGHGGVLDRIDALLLAAPVLWFYLLLRQPL